MPGYLLAQGLGLALALLASKILNDKKADHV
jgi:hypothetical protein